MSHVPSSLRLSQAHANPRAVAGLVAQPIGERRGKVGSDQANPAKPGRAGEMFFTAPILSCATQRSLHKLHTRRQWRFESGGNFTGCLDSRSRNLAWKPAHSPLMFAIHSASAGRGVPSVNFLLPLHDDIGKAEAIVSTSSAWS